MTEHATPVDTVLDVDATVGQAVGRRMLRAAGGVILVGHGLVHLMGVALLWHLAEPGELHYADVHPAPGTIPGLLVGFTWLVAALAFVLAGGLLVAAHAEWRRLALVASVLSVAVLVPSASMAAAGLVVDAVVLAGLTVGVAKARRSSTSMARRETQP